ncbi:MAG: MFS transporter [Lentisphaeria bacterium]|nr:MFS transporter [Lentisphaeria bacterium]
MIYPGPLKLEQRLKTQKNYCRFNLINGAAYMCLGETIIVLFAIKLNAPNGMVAALSACIYFAFFMLPVGKIVAGKVGAARSQAVFWTIRNFVAIGVAASSLTAYLGFPTLALVQIFVGACLFYGLRAAGVVMAQPFIGDMATESERPQLLGNSAALFYVGSVCSLLMIWVVLSWNESISAITCIIVWGAMLGWTSTYFIRQMDESPAMIKAARKPLMNEFRKVWQIAEIRKLLPAMFTATLAQIMLGAVSMLCVKRGLGVSDRAALYFSLIQFLSCCGVSYLSAKLLRRIGPRKSIFMSFSVILTVGILWLLAPLKMNYIYVTTIFILVGGAHIVNSNATTAYYLQITPDQFRVAASMLTSVVTSVLAGLAGMLLSSSAFRIIDARLTDWEPMNRFKVYFTFALILLGMLSFLIWRLPEKKTKTNK